MNRDTLEAFFKIRGKYQLLKRFSVVIAHFFGELKAKDEIKVQKSLEFIRTDFSSFIWMLADLLSHSALTVFQGNAKITQIPLMLRRKLEGTADTSWFYPSFAEERPCRRKFFLPNPP